MQISEEMIAAANAVDPTIKPEIVGKMLEAALSGQIFLSHRAGEEVKVGKSDFPDYLVVRVTDTYFALDVAAQLINGVKFQAGKPTLERPVDLLFSGVARISRDK